MFVSLFELRRLTADERFLRDAVVVPRCGPARYCISPWRWHWRFRVGPLLSIRCVYDPMRPTGAESEKSAMREALKSELRMRVPRYARVAHRCRDAPRHAVKVGPVASQQTICSLRAARLPLYFSSLSRYSALIATSNRSLSSTSCREDAITPAAASSGSPNSCWCSEFRSY